MHLLFTDVLTVAQVTVTSYQTVLVQEEQECDCRDYKCFGHCSVCRGTA